MTNRKFRAFTLVELLVVISIIGMLLALLVPAVSSALQAARLQTCTNNQHEIGIALKMYSGDNNRYPGYLQYIGTPINANVSWCVAIMPYLGHNDIYDQYSVAVSPPRRPANLANVQLLQCPVDGQDYSSGPWLSYVMNGGQTDTIEALSGVPTSQRRAQGISHNLTLPEGLEMYVDDGFIQSHDGTSKTLLMSHNNGAFQWTSLDEYLLCFLWKKGEQAPWEPLPHKHTPLWAPVNHTDPNTGIILPIGKATGPAEARMTSNHPGGVLALFADGHVQFLSDRLSNRVYRHLCTPWGRKADDYVEENKTDYKQTVISDTDLDL